MLRFMFVLGTALLTSLLGGGSAAAVEWIARTDLSHKEDQQLVNTLPDQGYVPIYSKATVGSDGQTRFDVVYVRPLVVLWEYRLCNDTEYEARNRDLQARGYSLVSHTTFRRNSILYHNCIWHK